MNTPNEILLKQAIEAEVAARVQYIEQEREYLKTQIHSLTADNKTLKLKLDCTEDALTKERWAREKLEMFVSTNRVEHLPISEEVRQLQKDVEVANKQCSGTRQEALAAWTENARLEEELQTTKTALAKTEAATTEDALKIKVDEILMNDRKEMEESLKRAFKMLQHETDRADLYRRQVNFFVQSERSSTKLPQPDNPLHLALMRIESLDTSISKLSPHHASWLRRYGQTTDLNPPDIPDPPKEWRTSAIQTEAEGNNINV
jgi:hypothetical protein